MKDPFEHRIYEFGDMKIKKHLTPEEEKQLYAEIEAMTMTEEDEKELEEAVKEGRAPAYMIENAKGEVMR